MEEKGKRDAVGPILIRLKGGDGTNEYHPGETLSGSIEIHPDSVITCRAVELKIGWHTEGKGNRDEGMIETKRYNVTSIAPDSPFYEQFDVTLPTIPWSHAGFFISIVWSVHVKIDVAMASDYNAERRFILQPSPV